MLYLGVIIWPCTYDMNLGSLVVWSASGTCRGTVPMDCGAELLWWVLSELGPAGPGLSLDLLALLAGSKWT